MFKPFDNDHQSMQIGELIFENQTDKVIVYGDIDITNTAVGLEQALKLKTVFTDIANALEKAQLEKSLQPLADDKNYLPEHRPKPEREANVSEQIESSKDIDNPFA